MAGDAPQLLDECPTKSCRCRDCVWLTDEEGDPAALYSSDSMALGHQPAWYSIDGYSYGINDWRGNAVAENHLRQRRPNDIPLDDVTPQTGNGSSAIVVATTAPTTTTATSPRLIVCYSQT